jgi:phage shock protein C
MKKRLYKIENGKKLCGVCGGISEYLNLDPTLVRLLWAVVTLSNAGVGIIGYIVAAFIMPDKSEIESTESEKEHTEEKDSN